MGYIPISVLAKTLHGVIPRMMIRCRTTYKDEWSIKFLFLCDRSFTPSKYPGRKRFRFYYPGWDSHSQHECLGNDEADGVRMSGRLLLAEFMTHPKVPIQKLGCSRPGRSSRINRSIPSSPVARKLDVHIVLELSLYGVHLHACMRDLTLSYRT